uniref:Yippee like 1 n=1 Tax=Eptatretus burgeri TaxID=7764 RepID=A0A8C4QWW1_EPTBU
KKIRSNVSNCFLHGSISCVVRAFVRKLSRFFEVLKCKYRRPSSFVISCCWAVTSPSRALQQQSGLICIAPPKPLVGIGRLSFNLEGNWSIAITWLTSLSTKTQARLVTQELSRSCAFLSFREIAVFAELGQLQVCWTASSVPVFQRRRKSFQGSQGRAYLFNSVVNVGCGPAEERVLLTGLHAVADIYCENCKTTLGWKYEHAFESSQKYKEGKYIIEVAHMIKDNGWEE